MTLTPNEGAGGSQSRVNTELGFLNPRAAREDHGKISNEGRYRGLEGDLDGFNYSRPGQPLRPRRGQLAATGGDVDAAALADGARGGRSRPRVSSGTALPPRCGRGRRQSRPVGLSGIRLDLRREPTDQAPDGVGVLKRVVPAVDQRQLEEDAPSGLRAVVAAGVHQLVERPLPRGRDEGEPALLGGRVERHGEVDRDGLVGHAPDRGGHPHGADRDARPRSARGRSGRGGCRRPS